MGSRTQGDNRRPPGNAGYRLLQTADLLLFRPASVLVRPDQRPYVEQARDRARRFNHKFGAVFPETKIQYSEEHVGTDGEIMLDNCLSNGIDVFESAKRIPAKTHGVSMDRGRGLRADPERPDCKEALTAKLDPLPETFRAARAKLDCRRSLVRDVLQLGGSEARIEGQRTLEVVKEAVGLRYGNLLG